MKEFKEFLKANKKESSIRLMYDVETYQYNTKNAENEPSQFKNCVYSVALSYIDKKDIKVVIFPNFKEMFDTILQAFENKKCGYSCQSTIQLIAHNSNKYDNHFMRNDLIYYYNCAVDNLFLKSATDNINTTKKTTLKKEDKKALILEKRVKSSNNLEMDIYLEGIHFITVDNYLKTQTTLRTIGTKLLKANLIHESELKTDFNYTEFNVKHDMTIEQSKSYAIDIFTNLLNESHFTYIKNDVIILGKCVQYYDTIFPNFDYNLRTFTSNILKIYNKNNLSSFQLLNSITLNNKKMNISYTDFKLGKYNYYDYLKNFFKGGLNFYNDKHVGKIVENCFSIDINSSYPYVMHHFQIPTFLKKFSEKPLELKQEKEYFYFMEVDYQEFNDLLLLIPSINIRKMLVKYYRMDNSVFINSNTIKIIELFSTQKIDNLNVLSYVAYECVDFGAKDEIEKNYFIKTQGGQENVIEMKSPYEYTITAKKNNNPYTREEIDNSKVILNGIYGIPSLRAYFNLFRLGTDGNIYNMENGYKNTERNILFSAFVTSQALYNLLYPLSFLSYTDIDNYFIYCDTDSLYLKKECIKDLPQELFDSISLGKWDIEHENIEYMYVLNHKKYALYDKKIIVKSGGIPHNAFNVDMCFQEFVKQEFYDGKEIKNIKSIFTKEKQIAIYESYTKMVKGNGYPSLITKRRNEQKKQLIKQIRKETKNDFGSDILYIESDICALGQSDIYPKKHNTKNTQSLKALISNHEYIKSLIL